MKKKDLAKLALLGITSGLLVNGQAEANTETEKEMVSGYYDRHLCAIECNSCNPEYKAKGLLDSTVD